MIKLNANMFIDSWKIIRFFVKNINRHLKTIDMTKKLKKFTTCQIFYFRQHKHNKFESVVVQSCISQLQKAFDPHYNIKRFDNLTLFDFEKVNVFDLQTTKKMTNCRFFNNAIDAISNDWSEKLNWCYRNTIKANELKTKLKMKTQNENCCRSMKKGEKKNSDDYFIMKNRVYEK